MHVCEQKQIPIELRSPRVTELSEADGAFLSSTSRLIMPIDVIVDATQGQNKEIQVPRSPLVERLRDEVIHDMHSHSTKIV